MGRNKNKKPFINVRIKYSQEEKLKRKIENRFIKKPTGKLTLNLRDRNKKLKAKLIIENMYGAKYSIVKLYNKGSSSSILEPLVDINNLIRVIIKEKDKVQNPCLNNIKNKLKYLK